MTYTVKNRGSSIEELASTSLKEEGLDEIRISPSGHTLILFDSNSCDSLTVMSVNR